MMTIEIKACLTHPVTPDLMSAIYTVKCIKRPEYNARGPGSAPGSSPGLAGMTEMPISVIPQERERHAEGRPSGFCYAAPE